MQSYTSKFQSALQAHQQGDFEAALALYQALLVEQPLDTDALHWCGVLYCQLGDFSNGKAFIDKAIEIQPNEGSYSASLGDLFRQQNLLTEAIQAYTQAIEKSPQDAALFCNLASLLEESGDWQKALEKAQQAIQLNPGLIQAHHNVGLILMRMGQLEDAQKSYETALSLAPDFYQGWVNLGEVCHQLKNLEGASQAYQRALALNPAGVEAWSNLSLVWGEQGLFQEATAAAKRAVDLEASWEVGHLNYGTVLFQAGDFESARKHLEESIELFPNSLELYRNLSGVYDALRLYSESLDILQKALSRAPEDPLLQFYLGMAYLRQGYWQEGWTCYEWRFKTGKASHVLSSFMDIPPRWQGESLTGKTLLVYAEQGYGDLFQFSRYLSVVKALGGTLWFVCHPGTESLCESLLVEHQGGVDKVFTPFQDSWSEIFSHIDFSIPLMSLPHVLLSLSVLKPKTLHQTISSYLRPTPKRIQHWKTWFSQNPNSTWMNKALKIGFVWSGSLTNLEGRSRSCPLSLFLKLIKASPEEIGWVSLQKNTTPDERALLSPLEVLSLDEELSTFDDTAAVISQLDLIISIDTGVAHLAGALGKEVWVLLPYLNEWRWGMAGNTSQEEDLLPISSFENTPWYPAMQVVRQSHFGQWESALQTIQQGLLKRLLSCKPSL
ncbi:MAG: tetratricopeptide repeat protein [Cyanobacteria bacterium]|nr:tetratricopeptide repeat protein [Cyanobacteriota bacterium]